MKTNKENLIKKLKAFESVEVLPTNSVIMERLGYSSNGSVTDLKKMLFGLGYLEKIGVKYTLTKKAKIFIANFQRKK